MSLSANVETVVKNEISWLQRHERLLIVFMVLAVGAFLGNRYINYDAAKKEAAATAAVRVAEAAKTSADQALAQAALTTQQYQAMVSMLQQQNAILAQAITQRDAILGKQQEAVKTAPLPEVASQWQGAIGGQGDITANTTGLNISDSGARKTLSMLLELPIVKADLVGEKEIAGNLQSELNGANKSLASNSAAISALNTEITTQDKACKAEIASVKAASTKSKVKWFKIGFITGFISGAWVSHATGL